MRRKSQHGGGTTVYVNWFTPQVTTNNKYRLSKVMGVGDVVFIPKDTQDEEENAMGLFGNLLGNKAKAAVQQFSGNTDFLEALCAGCALTAAAEGGISDEEFDQTLKVIRANSAISSGFSAGEIEQVFGKMAPKTATRSGKSELKNEIREVVARDKTGAMGQAVVLACLDVADTGGISDAEVTVMKSLAEICNVNYDKLAAG